MSTIARPRASSDPAQAHPAADALTTVNVSWLVSRSAMRVALARSRPDIVVGPSRASDSVRLTWTIRLEPGTDACAFAVATLHDPEHRTSVALSPETRGIVVRDNAGGDELLHVEVAGSIVCTLRAGRPLYASTPLLAALGLEGGRYDVLV